jgi:spore protease
MRAEGFDESLVYSDLAAERGRAEKGISGVEFLREGEGDFIWEKIKIKNSDGERAIGRPIGRYHALHTERLCDMTKDTKARLASELCREITDFFTYAEISDRRILVVGLGNPRLTPDSVGPRAVEAINPTMQIRVAEPEYFDGLYCSEIAAIAPDVSAECGIDSLSLVRCLARDISPSAVICIDSILTTSPERLGATFQLSDTGIVPGSGIGRRASAIDRNSLGVPVIAIGVPTVIDAAALTPNKSEAISGMLVSPREIDAIAATAGRAIGEAINLAFGLYF